MIWSIRLLWPHEVSSGGLYRLPSDEPEEQQYSSGVAADIIKDQHHGD